MTLDKIDFLKFIEKLCVDPTVDFSHCPELDDEKVFKSINPLISGPCIKQFLTGGPEISHYAALCTGILWGIKYKEWRDEKKQLEELANL